MGIKATNPRSGTETRGLPRRYSDRVILTVSKPRIPARGLKQFEHRSARSPRMPQPYQSHESPLGD